MKKSLYQKDCESEALFEEMMAVASASECTGLIPAAPMTNDEVESLREIYDIPPGQKDALLQTKNTSRQRGK